MGNIIAVAKTAFAAIRSLLSELSKTNAQFDLLLHRISTPSLPRKESSISFWQLDPPFPQLACARSPELPQSADVVIIGSGISGLSVAYSVLKEHGKLGKDLRVVVLEGRLLCSGATGRNGGHMKCSPYVDYHELKKAHGSSKAKAIVRFRMRQRQCILDVVEAEGLQGTEAREVDTSDVVLDLEEWNKAKMMVEELRSEFSEAAEGISMMEGDEAQRVCAYYNTNIACPITHYNIRLAPAHNAAV
jgi:hypothetical protein